MSHVHEDLVTLPFWTPLTMTEKISQGNSTIYQVSKHLASCALLRIFKFAAVGIARRQLGSYSLATIYSLINHDLQADVIQVSWLIESPLGYGCVMQGVLSLD